MPAGRADARALVVEGDRLEGIVSPTDAVRQLELSDLRDLRDHDHV